MVITDYLSDFDATGYFILDSHQDAMNKQEEGHQHLDSDFVQYSYNQRQNNKLEPGAFFLYRRPKKLSSDRKFHIYGGGIIKDITPLDNNGNVYATIMRGFIFDSPIDEGDEKIESFEWEEKRRPLAGWKGFWTNYGINRITEADFFGLIASMTGHEAQSATRLTDAEEEVLPKLKKYESFRITVGGNKKEGTVRARKVDFDSLNKRKKTIGTLGELLVLDLERQKLIKAKVEKEPEHVADTIGDGLGYDIRSYNTKGEEIHIEVKTTTSSKMDDFYISKTEMYESNHSQVEYYIYRLYNLNEENCSADLAIYSGPIDDRFLSEPVVYRVRLNGDPAQIIESQYTGVVGME